ncbi:hypothetical protein CBW46_004645 [Paenibacillus xerothermodurans]|uniref:Uncharacterized protein n=1 Tax=Paenibacillus xerothermodurans TaxID=1977292 RepID=A0A2W1NF67_PAEXE|nr:hypothetical protein CBW46_004645 [Paenibacillus xerothermodurans]
MPSMSVPANFVTDSVIQHLAANLSAPSYPLVAQIPLPIAAMPRGGSSAREKGMPLLIVILVDVRAFVAEGGKFRAVF